eukprot:1510127-Pleurochrysis_carterae.AAC.1
MLLQRLDELRAAERRSIYLNNACDGARIAPVYALTSFLPTAFGLGRGRRFCDCVFVMGIVCECRGAPRLGSFGLFEIVVRSWMLHATLAEEQLPSSAYYARAKFPPSWLH